mmetsp:Transcript_11858/g.18097  ORF Transcript_11858/g.18097 Transcript_11858/m.18097 type:complete len:121 (-) Transcript_11858:896-1258(-)
MLRLVVYVMNFLPQRKTGKRTITLHQRRAYTPQQRTTPTTARGKHHVTTKPQVHFSFLVGIAFLPMSSTLFNNMLPKRITGEEVRCEVNAGILIGKRGVITKRDVFITRTIHLTTLWQAV